jgi:Ca-activated chloride channel family protein
MSFAAPGVLLALIALPLLVAWYLRHHRRQGRVAEAFVTRPLRPSVAPHGPGWRRHAPLLVLLIAGAVLILAAARPQRSVAVPLTEGAVMLVDDVSSSMRSTDLTPSRLGAAKRAAEGFLSGVPSGVRVGLMSFAATPELLQSPTTDRAAVRSALAPLRAGGHTAIGDAINRAVAILAALKGPHGQPVPAAIVLLSDGTSNLGADPLSAARQAAARHIAIDTVALGTSHGTIRVGARSVPVPVDGSQLRQIAALSGGRAYTAGATGRLSAVYSHLAKALGHKKVHQEVTASFAGAGLVLVLFGGVLSLAWFGRLV